MRSTNRCLKSMFCILVCTLLGVPLFTQAQTQNVTGGSGSQKATTNKRPKALDPRFLRQQAKRKPKKEVVDTASFFGGSIRRDRERRILEKQAALQKRRQELHQAYVDRYRDVQRRGEKAERTPPPSLPPPPEDAPPTPVEQAQAQRNARNKEILEGKRRSNARDDRKYLQFIQAIERNKPR